MLDDKGYAGRDFARAVSDLDATIDRPRRRDEPGRGPHLAPIRQRIKSIIWTLKDILTLERHPRAINHLTVVDSEFARSPHANSKSTI